MCIQHMSWPPSIEDSTYRKFAKIFRKSTATLESVPPFRRFLRLAQNLAKPRRRPWESQKPTRRVILISWGKPITGSAPWHRTPGRPTNTSNGWTIYAKSSWPVASLLDRMVKMAVSVLFSLRSETQRTRVRFVPSLAAAALNDHFDHPANWSLGFYCLVTFQIRFKTFRSPLPSEERQE